MARLFTNGTVWTGIWRDGEVLASHALAEVNGRIAALGDAALEVAGTAQRIDLDGGFLMPGFGDGHAHPMKGGVASLFAPIAEQTSIAGIQQVVAQWAAENPTEPWVRGEGYDPALAPGGVFDAAWLDAVVPDRPVLLRASDHHTVWVNSKALQIAGISSTTPDPARGTIEREPMGTLREWGAWRLVDRHLPPLPAHRRLQVARRALEHFASLGVTFVQDAWVEPDDLDTWAQAPPLLRANLALLAEPEHWREQLGWFVETRAGGTESVRADSIKFFADGIVEGGTAHLLEPYCGCAERGLPNWPPGELAAAVTAVVGLGFQPHVHAIGDGGIRAALGAFAAAASVHGHAGRPVVAHSQLVDPADLGRFVELGVTANFEPLWARLDSDQLLLSQPRLGERRSARQYQIASLIRSGANVSFGSDWPISSANPLAGISVAVTRQMPDGTPAGGWLPNERITVDEALAAYTAGVARQVGATDFGILRPGARAELTRLAVDPRTVAPLDIASIPIQPLVG
ncbi:MAG: amidohydrolase [Actinobacteria bacterium]|nr:amidohydrolase [Actinomycetota bacterium]